MNQKLEENPNVHNAGILAVGMFHFWSKYACWACSDIEFAHSEVENRRHRSENNDFIYQRSIGVYF